MKIITSENVFTNIILFSKYSFDPDNFIQIWVVGFFDQFLTPELW